MINDNSDFLKILYGYQITQCLYLVAKLNIADHLSQKKLSARDLAIECNIDASRLYRVLRLLTSFNIFTSADNKFSLTPLGDLLRSNHPASMRDYVILFAEEHYNAAKELEYTVKTGLPGFEKMYGMNHWEFLDKNPDKAQTFNNAMQHSSAFAIEALLSTYDFSSYKEIVDVGGGRGHLLLAILGTYKHCNGIIYDLPMLKKSVEENIMAAEMSDRCIFEGGDFFEYAPFNKDVYILKFIMDDWCDEKATIILSTCAQAMKKTSKLLVIERVILPDADNTLTYIGDINMLVMLGGKERTIDEYEALMHDASLKIVTSYKTKSSFSIIEAMRNK